MGLDTYEALQEQYNALNELYDNNLEAVKQLQATLLNDILPGLIDELGLDVTAVDRSREWLQDTPTIFRTLKRQNFTASFALEELQTILLWRIHVLPQVASMSPSDACLTCLPPHCQDPFGRPMIVVQLGKLLGGTEDVKSILVYTVELMRLHLVQLNGAKLSEEQDARPILQYVVLLDIGGMSINSMSVETLSWLAQDLLPRYPGLLGAAFIVNYSWAHSGLWKLAQKILPASAIQKVFFVNRADLRDLFTTASLPEDWGGELPPITEIDNALRTYNVWPSTIPSLDGAQDRQRSDSESPGRDEARPEPAALPRTVLSSTSLLNPFFGYPAVYDPFAPPSLRHGRRRKRDLVYTLVRLWWARWRGLVSLAALALVLLLVLRKTKWIANLRTRWKRRQLQLSA